MYKAPKPNHHASFHLQRHFVNSSYVGRARNSQSPVLQLDVRRNSGGQQPDRHASPDPPLTSPKPYFKKPQRHHQQNQNHQQQCKEQTLANQQVVDYLHNSWSQLVSDYQTAQQEGSDRIVWYKAKASSHPGFKALDLDEWYAARLLKAVSLDPKDVIKRS